MKYRSAINRIVLFTGIALLFACGNKATQQTGSQKDSTIKSEVTLTKQQVAMMNIKLAIPEKRMLNTLITSPGKVVILSQYQANITAKISGSIEDIHVLEGQKITKGQTLITLSSPEFVQLQETYLSTKSELEFLKTDYERQKQLRKENVTGEKEFQLVKSKYESAMYKLQSAEARLRILDVNPQSLESKKEIAHFYEIKSPLSGFLYSLPVSIGMSALATTELAHVLNLDKMHADIFVYEKDIDHIFEGQKTQITFVNRALKDADGEVEFISRGIDPVKRSIIVHVVFDPPKGLVLPDMTVKATFIDKGSEQLAVPVSAIMHEDNESYIFTSRNEGDKIVFRKVHVTVGANDGNFSAINLVDSLKSNEQIVHAGTLVIQGEMKKGEMKD